jgi:hypothetical protein
LHIGTSLAAALQVGLAFQIGLEQVLADKLPVSERPPVGQHDFNRATRMAVSQPDHYRRLPAPHPLNQHEWPASIITIFVQRLNLPVPGRIFFDTSDLKFHHFENRRVELR